MSAASAKTVGLTLTSEIKFVGRPTPLFAAAGSAGTIHSVQQGQKVDERSSTDGRSSDAHSHPQERGVAQ
jgi:hypothetical protein